MYSWLESIEALFMRDVRVISILSRFYIESSSSMPRLPCFATFNFNGRACNRFFLSENLYERAVKKVVAVLRVLPRFSARNDLYFVVLIFVIS